jgi:HEAT repeat protein
MEPKQRDLGEVMDKVLGAEQELLSADLAAMSNLNADGISRFRGAWGKTPLKRRTQVISRMISLSEDDFVLDFTGEFQVALDDPEESIRMKALEGLELEDKYIYARPIIRTLNSDESADVRAVAAKALSKFALMTECGDVPEVLARNIFDALVEKLEDLREPLSVRRRALEAIAPFQEQLVEQYIEDYYHNDDPKVRASALFAMGVNCNSRWLTFLIDEMHSDTAELRYEAAKSSGEIGEPEAIPHLNELVNDRDHEVQDAAILALGKIGGDAAKRILQKLGKSPNARIKDAAKAALAELIACEDPLSSSF